MLGQKSGSLGASGKRAERVGHCASTASASASASAAATASAAASAAATATAAASVPRERPESPAIRPEDGRSPAGLRER
jgi:hypothetical protein